MEIYVEFSFISIFSPYCHGNCMRSWFLTNTRLINDNQCQMKWMDKPSASNNRLVLMTLSEHVFGVSFFKHSELLRNKSCPDN